MRIKKKNLIFEQRLKANMPVPSPVRKLYNIFVKNGFELYIVGGAVRDFLTQSKIKDYDLATDATNEQIESMMVQNGIGTKATGTRFTVQNVWLDEEWYEVATFRTDSKGGDGRRPDSVTYSDINGDAQRRDLTINALYYDIKTKEIVDLVGGMEDIKNRVVRTVGAADERFEEDRLRILRAIRFTARVGSTLDPAIDKSIKANNSLDLLAAEAIKDEFEKGIKTSKSTRQYLSLLDKYGLFKWVLKGIDSFNHKFVESNDFVVVLASMLINNNPEKLYKKSNGTGQLPDLKYDRKVSSGIKFLVTFYQTHLDSDSFATLKKLHNSSFVNDNTFKEFIEVMNMDMNLSYKFMNFKYGTVKGDDVMIDNPSLKGNAISQEIERRETELFNETL
jgi:tRNA nucleotidyltransferase/poly(A) polymerase